MGFARELIPRQTYLDDLKKWEGSGLIRVLQGVRRCGKSSILATYGSALLKEGVPQENVIIYNESQWLRPEHADAAYLKETLSQALDQSDSEYPRYVLLDEVQEVDGWERVVRQLQTVPGCEIVVTGSNAFLLSGELGTLLSGRYVRIPIWPLSFSEYRVFKREFDGTENSVDDAYPSYQLYGGMPVLFSLRNRDEEAIRTVLSSVYDTVIMNDVALRTGVRDYPLLDRLCRYLFRTSGNLFSANSVRNYLVSNGMKVHVNTIDAYLGALEDALILHSATQNSLSEKALLNPRRKYYPVDTGLRNLASGFSNLDTGFQLENVVYLELLRRRWDVSVGKTVSGEIDFVCRRGSDQLYVQVSEDLSSPQTRKRELAPLNELGDSFPKLVLTLDRLHEGVTETGIRIEDARDWLLETDHR